MYRIEKIEIDEEVLLNYVSDTDHEYNIRLYDKCLIIKNNGHSFKGFISLINDDELTLLTEGIGTITIAYNTIKEIQKIELVQIKLSSFRYIVTDIGGGWGTIHKLYGVTQYGDTYMTENFNENTIDTNTELTFEYIGHLDNMEIGLKSQKSVYAMDTSYLVMIEVGREFKIIYEGNNISENNPDLYTEIQKLVYEIQNKKRGPK